MNDRWRFGLAFGALMVGAATASHYWALDETGVALGALVAAVVVCAVLLAPRRRDRSDLE